MAKERSSNSKSTGRALLASFLALLLCLSTLLGTTFAWFTDSASTGVNTIKAGNLDVEIVDANGIAINGPLSFQKASDGSGQEVLWEPGCTYNLQEFYVKNKGSLNLKFKIQIAGIGGDQKLNEAIEWTVVEGSGESTSIYKLDEILDKILTPKDTENCTAGPYVIKGHMKEDAGNEYQNLSIENVSITVVATQAIGEYDSVSNDYDKDAQYPMVATPVKINKTVEVKSSEDTTIKDESANASIVIPSGAVSEDQQLTFKVETTSNTPDSTTFEISLLDSNNNDVKLNKAASVTLNIGIGLSNVTVTHNNTLMDSGDYSYNSVTGILSITTETFSPFTVNFDYNPEATLNNVGYATINDALSMANDGDTVVVNRDVSDTSFPSISFYDSNETASKTVTVNLNNHTVSGERVVQVAYNGYKLILKNGTIASSADEDTICVFNDSTIELDGITVDSNNIGVASYGQKANISIKNSTINSNYFGVYHNGSTSPFTLTMENTTVVDSHATGVYVSNSSAAGRDKQTVTIKQCDITGPTAVEVKHTDMTISNSTLTATVVPESFKKYNNGTTSVGFAIAVTTNATDEEKDLVTGTVTVTNCTLSNSVSNSPAKCFVYSLSEGANVTINGTSYTGSASYVDDTDADFGESGSED